MLAGQDSHLIWKRAVDLFVYWESGAVFIMGGCGRPGHSALCEYFINIGLNKLHARLSARSHFWTALLWQIRCGFDMSSQHCILCSPASEFNEAITAKS